MFTNKTSFGKALYIISDWICNWLLWLQILALGTFDLISFDKNNIFSSPLFISLIIIIFAGLIQWCLISRFTEKRKLSRFLWFHMVIFPLTIWYEIQFWKKFKNEVVLNTEQENNLSKNHENDEIIIKKQNINEKLNLAGLILDSIFAFGLFIFTIIDAFLATGFFGIIGPLGWIWLCSVMAIETMYCLLFATLVWNIVRSAKNISKKIDKKSPKFVRYVSNSLQFLVY